VSATLAPRSEERLLTFELGGAVYALPIDGVLEVVEAGELACVPTLPTALGGAMNYHGDALPVIRPQRLLGLASEPPDEPGQVVVLCERGGAVARLGIPVDRVLGLCNGGVPGVRGPDPVADRRELDGRIAHVLDPRRVAARAREVIEETLRRAD